MTSASSKSLDQLERETEQNRAVLVETVDALRETVLGEVEDMRRKVSIGYIKNEIGDYARSTGSAWYESLRRNVRDNPLRSVAVGAGLTVPLWKIGRSIPMPLVLIGAGVALARPATRDAIGSAAGRATSALTGDGERSGEHVGGAASDLVQGTLASIKDAGAQTGQRAASALDVARGTIGSAAGHATSRASDVLGAGSDTASGLADRGRALLQGGSDRVADARGYAGRAAGRTQSAAIDLFERNPLLVAGAGVAIGALIAAIVPTTAVEGRFLDGVAPDLKRKATDLVDQGYEAVGGVAGDAYGGAVDRAKDHGLSPQGARDAASGLSEKLGAVIDAAVGHDEGHPDTDTTGTNQKS